MVSTSGSTEIGIKANSKTASNMDKEPRSSQMVISIKDSMWKVNPTAMANIIGRMAVTSKEISNKDWEMDTVCGKKVQEQVINMKENTLEIRNTAMVFFHGHLEMFIRETMNKTWEMVMVKCTGVMEVITKELGLRESKMVKEFYLFLGKEQRKEYLKIMYW